jgi:hypothetical protein
MMTGYLLRTILPVKFEALKISVFWDVTPVDVTIIMCNECVFLLIIETKKLLVTFHSCKLQSASNIFLEAVQILHCCSEKNGVLGGAVLFQNK